MRGLGLLVFVIACALGQTISDAPQKLCGCQNEQTCLSLLQGGWMNSQGVSTKTAVSEPVECIMMYVHIVDQNNVKQTNSTMFILRVDEFSQLVVNQTSALSKTPNLFMYVTIPLTVSTNGTTFSVQTAVASPLTRYTSEAGDLVVLTTSLYIEVAEGFVTKGDWLGNCNQCKAGDVCLQTAAQINATEFSLPNTGSCGVDPRNTDICGSGVTQSGELAIPECNIRMYVGWQGVDRSDRKMVSFSSLPPNFGTFGVGDIWLQAAQVVNWTISQWKTYETKVKDTASSVTGRWVWW